MRRKKNPKAEHQSQAERCQEGRGTGHVTGVSCPQCPQLTEKAGPATATGLLELKTAKPMWRATGHSAFLAVTIQKT